MREKYRQIVLMRTFASFLPGCDWNISLVDTKIMSVS